MQYNIDRNRFDRKIQDVYLFHRNGDGTNYQFDQVHAGDYIALILLTYDSDCCRCLSDNFVIAKVLSSKVKSSFWSGTPGEITLEFPDGEVETLDYKANFGKSKALNKYLQTTQYYERNFSTCNLWTVLYRDFQVLKEDMQAYHHRKYALHAAAQEEKRKQQFAEQERRRAEEELRRRNASVSSADLDATFRGRKY